MNIKYIFGLIGFWLVSISANLDLKRLGKVIIDTDGGGDDAGAILLALMTEKQSISDDFEVIAITCSYGNSIVENVEKNVLKILTIANRTDIPVYAGVSKPLIHNFKFDFYFGIDGMGDVNFTETIGGKIDRSKHASVALIDLAQEHAGNVSILALAPLTNIAIAITLDSNFVNNVERFFIVGASILGVGNIAPGVEFNFYQDPHSNFIVLNSIEEPSVILFPWELTLIADIRTGWRTEVLGAIDSRTIRFLNQVERNSFRGNDAVWEVADIMLTGLALWPNLIRSFLWTNLTPIYDGSVRGFVVVDYRNVTRKPPNVQILSNFDVEAFKKLLIDTFLNVT